MDTREQKIEAIRQRVKQSVPEILEPAFGCAVVDERDQHALMFIRQQENGMLSCYDTVTDSIIDISATEVEVKGRPIHLTDILASLFDSIEFSESDGENIISLWDWKQDDLNLQPETTLTLIINTFDL